MDVSADLKGGTEQKGEVQKPTAWVVLRLSKSWYLQPNQWIQ